MQEDWNIILSVLESPDASLIGQQKVFSTSPITLGRGEDNDMVISDPTISRSHAVLRITNDYTRVFITDTSTYGTEVSGKRVPKGPGHPFVEVKLTAKGEEACSMRVDILKEMIAEIMSALSEEEMEQLCELTRPLQMKALDMLNMKLQTSPEKTHTVTMPTKVHKKTESE